MEIGKPRLVTPAFPQDRTFVGALSMSDKCH